MLQVCLVNSESVRIRATYTTHANPLPCRFVELARAVPRFGDMPPTVVVTPADFVPSLIESELERIDNTIFQFPGGKRPPQSVREIVRGDERARPVVGCIQAKSPDQCANCNALKPSKMRQCGRYVACCLTS